jgi:hypothetical protein
VVSERSVGRKPSLSVLALVSFIASFVIARAFTTLSPSTVVITQDIHVHHFWYGIIMLAIGGWLGISYSNERIDRLAAILFGAGGGIIGDEAGLLLTFGDYWTTLTYTVIITFLAVVTTMITLIRYAGVVQSELSHFTRTNASLYVGAFVASISVAIIMETNNIIVTALATALTLLALLIIAGYFIQRVRRRR